MDNKGICIVGSGRSGTSFLMNQLHQNGCFIGECVGGNLENVEVRRINESYLETHHQGKTRSKLPYGILPEEEIQIDSGYKEHAIRCLGALSQGSSGKSTWWNDTPVHWAFKDPRTTLLHDMWIDHSDIIIGMFRNPLEVVNSYMKLLGGYYPDEEFQQGASNMLDYWMRFNQSLIHIFNTYDKPKYMLDFNGDMSVQLKTLFAELGIELQVNTYDKSRVNQSSDEIYDDHRVVSVYDQLRSLKNLT